MQRLQVASLLLSVSPLNFADLVTRHHSAIFPLNLRCFNVSVLVFVLPDNVLVFILPFLLIDKFVDCYSRS